MKTSIWDILTGVILLVTLLVIVGVGFMVLNSNRPGGTVVEPIATISIPTATATVPGLPPTWTPQASATSAEATRRPTSTIPPTDTPVVLPTFTVKPRATLASSGPATCRVVYQNPVDNSTQNRSTSFQMRWTIQNLSGSTWDASGTDIRFLSGDKMQTGPDVYDLPYSVPDKSNVDVIINMRTPSSAGDVGSYWAMYSGNTVVCKFFVEFSVK